MPQVAVLSQSRHETISLHQILSRLHRGWAIVLVSTLVTFGLAVGYLEFTTPVYTADMAIAPPTQSSTGRSGSALSGLGSIAGLALGGDTGGTNTSFIRYEKMLTSREVAARLVRDHDVLQLVFADRWDAVHQTWKPPFGIVEWLKSATNHVFGRTVDTTPDAAELRRFLAKHLSIEVPPADMALAAPPAIRYVKFTFRDPRVAPEILLWLHQETDGVIREAELARTRHMIDYLDDSLRKTTEVDERASLAQLLLDQERSAMLLTTGLDYSAEVIDLPGVPQEPSYPEIPLTLILGVLTGLLLGSLLAISRDIPELTGNQPAHGSYTRHKFRWFR
jgi:uncharacterized protein involved in exopolysaccharide biosynthesis